MEKKELYFNGINGTRGTYNLPPMTEKQLADHILGIEVEEPDNLPELKARKSQDMLEHIRDEKASLERFLGMTGDNYELAEEIQQRIDKLITQEQDLGHLGAIAGVDRNSIAQAGWGIIFPTSSQRVPQLKEALAPLLELRQSQTQHFKIYEGKNGFRQKDTASTFLAHNGARASDPANPEKVPYYLLIVGSPEEIDFQHQYQLDVQYAVGRIDYGDDMQAYANYARSVAEAAGGKVKLTPKASFFGVANEGDSATNLGLDNLIDPLYKNLIDRQGKEQRLKPWQFDVVPKGQATKARLQQLLDSENPPAFLFTASHGMAFDMNDTRQTKHQGALLCQDWPGPAQWKGEIPKKFYFAGDDLSNDTNLLGMIAFFFACFGGGTPRYDAFSKRDFKANQQVITEHPFVAPLPKAMLSLEKGGALAVIGHIDKALSNSFLDDRKNLQIGVFQSVVEDILKGHPVGSAMEYFNGQYAALGVELAALLEQIDFGRRYDPYDLAQMWANTNDARGYMIIGDPAVSLRVAAPDGSPQNT